MTKAYWKALDSRIRRVWRDQDMERKLLEAYRDCVILGVSVIPEFTEPLIKPYPPYPKR